MNSSNLGILFGAVLVGALTGCVGYVDEPRYGRGYAPPPSVYVDSGIQDDYVYYPSYQVYYSSIHHNYIYLDGRSWVTRPTPPRVSVDVLFASPSVRLGFHDAPSFHHSQVVRQYPRHWAPPGHEQESPGEGRGNQDNRRGRGWGNVR